MTIYHLNKVAKISVLFWLLKIVATTLGETFGDFLSMTLNLGYTIGIAITLTFFLAALTVQLLIKKYHPVSYWLVIVGTTTLGTEISDYIDRTLQLGYLLGTIFLLSCLMATLILWFLTYKNLDVYPITDKQKEIYYWMAILFSNSLGTAFGDFLGDYFGFSYLQGAYITGTVILAVVLLHLLTKINSILLFWIAFIFTRPFGATFGDFLTKPLNKGGLQLGTLNSSLFCMGLMIFLILISKRKIKMIN